MKRIAHVVSSQHLKPTGGIGTLIKSTTDLLMQHDTIIDIIVDKSLRGATKEFVEDLLLPPQINLFYNLSPLKYDDNSIEQSMYNPEGVNYKMIVNFQEIFLQRSRIIDYDFVVVHTQEAMAAIATLDTKCPVYLYTHLYKQVYPEITVRDSFLPVYHTFYNQFLSYDNVTVATQCERNKQLLENPIAPASQARTNVEVIPMPLADLGLLKKSTHEREGVLFIGATSLHKNYRDFIKVIKETNLPARVMTTHRSAITFKQKFEEAGITDYDIRVNITGHEKVDFITSSRVCFMPSKVECYGFVFLETVAHMPVVVLDNQIWSDSFDSQYYFKVNKQDMVQTVKDVYKITPQEWYETGAFEYMIDIDKHARNAWIAMVSEKLQCYIRSSSNHQLITSDGELCE